jgi:hypothetical protein
MKNKNIIEEYCLMLLNLLFFPEGGGGSSIQARMPTYVSILRIPQFGERWWDDIVT